MIDPEVRKVWAEETAKLHPELQNYIRYAADKFEEELGLRPRGSSRLEPLKKIDEEDQHYEPRQD